ncbi:hypothetical protein [Agrobacterium vaccinii]|uniref:hypothetical protein n=1 Tax=Agrobacterium vaccinii TaxID=2735528 RepID=UPI001E466CD7|nr:hypothetical protein [Agrobacterium vaccinii]UHS56809.1 hypothetical protein HRS00_08340 [Agrobacterium vaccinii]
MEHEWRTRRMKKPARTGRSAKNSNMDGRAKLDIDFWDTDAGKFISRAKCFLEAAYVLDDKMHDGRSGMLFAPALHLTGHGLELMLKGCLLHNGLPKKKAISYGHDVNQMWDHDLVAPMRQAARVNAGISFQMALEAKRFPDTHKVDDPVALFDEYRIALGALHAEQKHYPIRYPTDVDRVAPRTPLLVAALWRTADDYVKRPGEFSTRGYPPVL